jgi:hypothetical protein
MPIDAALMDKLVTARRLRNKIIHEGFRLPFDDNTDARSAAAAVTDALALLERVVATRHPRTNEGKNEAKPKRP